MKTTCLFAALSGLAMAQEPTPVPRPMPRVPAVPAAPGVPGVPGMPADVTIPTFERGQLGEPLRWSFAQGRAQFHDVVRAGPVGFLGINASILPRELSVHLTLPEDTGLLVEVVGKDSPAEKAGLQKNDVLAKFDDQILIDPRQLSVLVANKKEGDTVKITYVRKGESHETSVAIGKRDGAGPEPHVGRVDAEAILEGAGGKPLRTFVRRFEIPGGGGGEVRIVGDDGDVKVFGGSSGEVRVEAGSAPGVPGAPPFPPNDDVKKQLEEIRAMLEALQQKVK
jgi:membrane-associated protease RseP (regulator of RpoE activity)